MSRYQPYERDWEDKNYLAIRDKLAALIPELDDFIVQYLDCVNDHKGTCWDWINDLAEILSLEFKEINK